MSRLAGDPVTVCWYLVVYEHAVKVQSLIAAAGPTQGSSIPVRQKAEAGSLVVQSLALGLQDQVQQGLCLPLLVASQLERQQTEHLSVNLPSGKIRFF